MSEVFLQAGFAFFGTLRCLPYLGLFILALANAVRIILQGFWFRWLLSADVIQLKFAEIYLVQCLLLVYRQVINQWLSYYLAQKGKHQQILMICYRLLVDAILLISLSMYLLMWRYENGLYLLCLLLGVMRPFGINDGFGQRLVNLLWSFASLLIGLELMSLIYVQSMMRKALIMLMGLYWLYLALEVQNHWRCYKRSPALVGKIIKEIGDDN